MSCSPSVDNFLQFIITILIIVPIYLPNIVRLQTNCYGMKGILQPELSSPERCMLSYLIAVKSLQVTVCRTLINYMRTPGDRDKISLWWLITADPWWKSSVSQQHGSHELSVCGVRHHHFFSVRNGYINVPHSDVSDVMCCIQRQYPLSYPTSDNSFLCGSNNQLMYEILDILKIL